MTDRKKLTLPLAGNLRFDAFAIVQLPQYLLSGIVCRYAYLSSRHAEALSEVRVVRRVERPDCAGAECHRLLS